MMDSTMQSTTIEQTIAADLPAYNNPDQSTVEAVPSERIQTHLVNSGWSAILPVPLAKVSSTPILVVRLNADSQWHMSATNHDSSSAGIEYTPLQFSSNFTLNNTTSKIIYEPVYHEHMILSRCHAIVKGSIDVCLRVTSNTTISGQLMVVQAENQIRNWKGIYNGGKYVGYKTLTSQLKGSYADSNFALSDLSLTRHIEARTSFSQVVPHLFSRFAKKLIGNNTDPVDIITMDAFAFNMPENVLYVYLDTDVSGPAGFITVTLYVDFSKLQYEHPILPLYYPLNLSTQLDVTTFYNRSTLLSSPLEKEECSPESL